MITGSDTHHVKFNSHTVGFQWLSNFSLHAIVDDSGLTWPTVEHYYQAQKDPDPLYQQRVRVQLTASRAKREGKHATLRPDWSDYRLTVMRRALEWKFAQHPDLRKMLFDTGIRPLYHLSPWDLYWGVGHDGAGENRLGRMIMAIRSEIKE